jgi:hypothetical protein
MPWNPAAFKGIPEPGPGLKPTLPGLNIGDGAEGEIPGEKPGPPPGAWGAVTPPGAIDNGAAGGP